MTIGRCEADAACYTSCRRALDSGKSVRQREPLDKRELRARRRMLASHTAVGTRLLKVSESPRATKRSGDASQTPHAIESCRRSELDSGKSVSRAGCLSLRPASPLSHKTSGSCGALGHHERVVRRAPSRMSVGTTESARTERGPVCHYNFGCVWPSVEPSARWLDRGRHTNECSGSGKTVSDSSDGVCALGLL